MTFSTIINSCPLCHPQCEAFHSNTTFLPAKTTACILITWLQMLNHLYSEVALPEDENITRQHLYQPFSVRFISTNPFHYPRKEEQFRLSKSNIGGALKFSELKSLAAFFQHGVSRLPTPSYRIRFHSVSYIEDDTVTGWRREHTGVCANEAFEALDHNWGQMEICWLQLRFPSYRANSSVDDSGIWSLSKIRGLAISQSHARMHASNLKSKNIWRRKHIRKGSFRGDLSVWKPWAKKLDRCR